MKWEYKTVSFIPNLLSLSAKKIANYIEDSLNKELKTLGEEGWELVSTTAYDRGSKFVLIFKRPVE